MASLVSLYRKYEDELIQLSRKLRPQFHAVQRGFGTGFQDIEGEVAYLLIREHMPEQIFEISPASGWSTNYLLSAVTANRKGVLHSFDILEETFGVPTETAIRGNLLPECDQERLRIHIGDATETVKKVPGEIQFLMLDSCHERWFAEWYVEKLFPRVKGQIFIQDIAYADGVFPSGEAQYVWEWLFNNRYDATFLDQLSKSAEAELSAIRVSLSERRSLRSNALYLEWPPRPRISEQDSRYKLEDSPSELLTRSTHALAARNREEAEKHLNQLVFKLIPQFHRADAVDSFLGAAMQFEELGIVEETDRCLMRAVGFALGREPKARASDLVRILDHSLKTRKPRLFFRACLLLALEPARWPRIMVGRWISEKRPRFTTGVKKMIKAFR